MMQFVQRLICMFCQKRFLSPKGLVEHIMDHHLSSQPFLCCHPNCFSQFSSEGLFNIHCQLKHNGVMQCIQVGNQHFEKLADYLINRLETFQNLPADMQLKLLSNFNLMFNEIDKCQQEFLEDVNPVDCIDVSDLKVVESMMKKYKSTKRKVVNPEKHRFKPKNGKLIQACQRKLSEAQCCLCQRTFSSRHSLNIHAVNHLKTDYKVDWLYKCSICSCWTSMYLWDVQKHCISRHSILATAVKKDIHYIEQKSLYENELKIIRQSIFRALKKPYYGTKLPTKNVSSLNEIDRIRKNVNIMKKANANFVNKKFKNRSQKCQLCKISISSSSLFSHVVVHFREKTGVNWLYKCLLCDNFDSLRIHSLKRHVAIVHAVDCAVQENKHYTCQKTKFEKELEEIRSLAFPR